jgi:hypothetical protein
MSCKSELEPLSAALTLGSTGAGVIWLKAGVLLVARVYSYY